MTYSESAEGIIISHKRAIKELESHGAMAEIDSFYEELGDKPEYKASDVLAFLGY
jgi:hypothetical protein